MSLKLIYIPLHIDNMYAKEGSKSLCHLISVVSRNIVVSVYNVYIYSRLVH